MYCLQKLYVDISEIMKLEFEKLNGLQNLVVLAIMKIFLNYYI
jgi:hypothetical protein